jgi:uncharacterized protein YukE
MDESNEEPATDPLLWANRTILLGRLLVVGAVVMTVIALLLVERVSATYEDGLEITAESALLLSDSVVPISELSRDLAGLAATLGEGLESARGVLATTQQVLDDIGAASSTNLAETASAAADIADRLAAVIEAIERFIPGDSQSLAEELRSFADGLEPVADQLVALGDQLVLAADQLDTADASVAALVGDVNVLAADIEALTPTFDALAVTAEDLHARADAAATRLGLDKWLVRLLVIVAGAVVAVIGVTIERFAPLVTDRRIVIT